MSFWKSFRRKMFVGQGTGTGASSNIFTKRYHSPSSRKAALIIHYGGEKNVPQKYRKGLM